MDVYFVRHGETADNRRHVHQLPEAPLSDAGRMQVAKAAEALEGKGIETVLSSTFDRAIESAQIIDGRLEVGTGILESVHEVRRPKFIYGCAHMSVATFRYLWQVFRNQQTPDWDYGGAENLYMVATRIRGARSRLEASGVKSIAVVSHTIFISMFLEMVCNQKGLTFWSYVRAILNTHRVKNSSITHLRFDPEAPAGTCPWTIVDFANVDHLK